MKVRIVNYMAEKDSELIFLKITHINIDGSENKITLYRGTDGIAFYASLENLDLDIYDEPEISEEE